MSFTTLFPRRTSLRMQRTSCVRPSGACFGRSNSTTMSSSNGWKGTPAILPAAGAPRRPQS